MFAAENSHTNVTQTWASGLSFVHPGMDIHKHNGISGVIKDLLIFFPVLSPEIRLHGRNSHLWGKSGPSCLRSCAVRSADRSRPHSLKTFLIQYSRLVSVSVTSRLLWLVKCASRRVKPRTRKCFLQRNILFLFFICNLVINTDYWWLFRPLLCC